MHQNGRVYWLWCCLGVLLAGCGHALTATTTATPSWSLLTLARPTLSPTAILRLIRTPTIWNVNTPAQTPVPIPLSTPTCYDTAVGSMWCFGLLHNTLPMPIYRIAVQVYVVNAEGLPLAQLQVNTARTWLAPGEITPYGALFEKRPSGMVGAVTILVNAATDKSSSANPLVVSNLVTEQQDGVFRVTGALNNKSSASMRDLMVVVTLFDDQQRVTGFRQVRWPAEQVLESGAALAFKIETVPQGSGTARVEVSAEGRVG